MILAPQVTLLRLRLREAREDAEMTQAELAEAAGVRQATVSDLDRGKTRRVEFDVLERLAKALDVEASSLIVPDKKWGR